HKPMTERQRGLTFATITATSWAVLAIALKYVVTYISAGSIVWFRMAVAFLGLFLFYLIKSPHSLKILFSRPWLAVLAGLFLSFNYYGFMKGIELTTASNAQIMIQMAPMTLILIGILYFKEVPSSQQKLGFLLAISGFSLFYWDQLESLPTHPSALQMGNLWIIGAALTWALFATFQKILLSKWTPQQINLVIYGVSTLFLFPLATPIEFSTLPINAWIILIFLGMNTVIAYGSLGEALKRAPASQVSVIVSANPLLTLSILAILHALDFDVIKHEPVHSVGYFGAALVISGVICTVLKNKPVSSQE
ncbi:MAG: DMT family transporter, partial [Bdellovibrionales bacterium]|nr:DMT family transporter [Bdellovibrionales bacterium]